jgi:hypothetical protein
MRVARFSILAAVFLVGAPAAHADTACEAECTRTPALTGIGRAVQQICVAACRARDRIVAEQEAKKQAEADRAAAEAKKAKAKKGPTKALLAESFRLNQACRADCKWRFSTWSDRSACYSKCQRNQGQHVEVLRLHQEALAALAAASKIEPGRSGYLWDIEGKRKALKVFLEIQDFDSLRQEAQRILREWRESVEARRYVGE